MKPHNSNTNSPHSGVAWYLWCAADSAHALGQLTAIDYSDSTPDVAFTYDRQGRQLTVTDVLGTRTNVYSPTDLLEERHPDGTALVRSYDAYGRASGIALGPDYAVGYGYDEYGRFSIVAVTNGATFTYSYLSNSSLLSGYTNDLSLAVAYEYEPLRDVKTLVSNAWSTNVISTFAYEYDALGRRTQRIDDATTTNLFGYNPRSELVSAEMGTNTYAYAYDPIGNRSSASENGTTTTYAANELNQYTALNPTSTNPTPFTYDADGNMTSDGTWSYAWDAENRLIGVSSNGIFCINNRYDFMSRRIEKASLTETNSFLYDGWNLIRETIAGVSSLSTNRYIWGLDLTQSLQGAGGIGGLLMQHHSDYTSPWFFFCDGNGNIVSYVNEPGLPSAQYIYDAYGNIIQSARPQTNILHFGFSTKYHDHEIGLVAYQYRFYIPSHSRWLSRDPISETGTYNLYCFVKNSPCNKADYLGLIPTLANFALNCLSDIAINYLHSSIEQMIDGNIACREVDSELLRRVVEEIDDDASLCNGLEFDIHNNTRSLEKPISTVLTECLFHSLLDFGVEKLLSSWTNPIERDILERLTEREADSLIDVLLDKNFAIISTHITASCQREEPKIIVQDKILITNGGHSWETTKTSAPFFCSRISKSLNPRLALACCGCQQQKGE